MPDHSQVGPNLFLVGAPKCGTTSLYEYLRQHPQIFFPHTDSRDYSLTKEPQHFCPDLELSSKYSISDREDYLALYEGTENVKWRGDASTYYLFSEAAPGLIRQFCPQARILIMLRPPLEMMRSYHRELLRWGQEDIVDFQEAVAASSSRKRGERLPHDRGVAKCLDYVAISHFASGVERYQHTFGCDAVKVVLLEDMVAAPTTTFRSILKFLDVDESFQPEFRVHNETPGNSLLERAILSAYGNPAVKRAVQRLFPYRARHALLSLVRHVAHDHARGYPHDEALEALLRPDIERLSSLIKRDLTHWLH